MTEVYVSPTKSTDMVMVSADRVTATESQNGRWMNLTWENLEKKREGQMTKTNPVYVSGAVVVAALLVMAPRLIIAFVTGDARQLDTNAEYALIVGAAIAGSIVLTLGNAYLTHALATNVDRDDRLFKILAVGWMCYLLLTVVIVAPSIQVGVIKSALATVLTADWQRWGWSIASTVVFELLVAGAMAAHAIVTHTPTPSIPAEVPPPASTEPSTPPPPSLDDTSRRILAALRDNPDGLSNRMLGDRTGVSHETARKRVKALADAGLVSVNGVVKIAQP